MLFASFNSSCSDNSAILSIPTLSKANKLNYTSVKTTNDLKKINRILKSNNNEVCEIFISPKKMVIPQVKFGSPIEDAHPLLKKETLQENMLIKSIIRSD